MISRFDQLSVNELARGLKSVFAYLAEPHTLVRVQAVLFALLAVWCCFAAAQIVWALIPGASQPTTTAIAVNPPALVRDQQTRRSVDLESLLGLGLFGEPINTADTDQAASTVDANSREGIESGAQETRLALTLQGILASTTSGLGTAVIEASGSQENYVVGDKLPVNGSVSLAKVLPKQVVIDNNGTYELLTLFAESALDLKHNNAPSEPRSSVVKPEAEPGNKPVDLRVNDRERSVLATRYREQLYDDPSSLAELVSLSAVRADGGIKGYRVTPGSNAQQFTAFGFKAGDIVTAVNGLSLSDTTNTMRLYQLMRDANEASFDIDRGGTPVSISVSLSNPQ